MSDGAPLDALAERIAAAPRPLLVGVDVDGTLAPIVGRPEDARLAPGARAALAALAALEGVTVAVVSGRPMADLRSLFDLPPGLLVIGSHGAEVDGDAVPLESDEAARLATITDRLAAAAAELPGAWVEHKPVASVLHVRQADPVEAARVLAHLEAEARADPSLTVHVGHMVLEIAVRGASKDLAVAALRRGAAPATTLFVGDDASDERVFVALAADGDAGISIKVGPGDTVAPHRLGDPDAVVALLAAIAERAGAGRP